MAEYTYYFDLGDPGASDFISLAVGQGVIKPDGTVLEQEIIDAGLPASDTIIITAYPTYQVRILFSAPVDTGILYPVIQAHTGLREGELPPDGTTPMDHGELGALDADDHLHYLTIINGSVNPNSIGVVAQQGRLFYDIVLGITYRQMESPSGSVWRVK